MLDPIRDIDRSGGPTPGDPTPEDFERLAEWAESSEGSPEPTIRLVALEECGNVLLSRASYLLRRIAEAYREAQEGGGGDD